MQSYRMIPYLGNTTGLNIIIESNEDCLIDYIY